MGKFRGHPGLNQGPLDLQSNALPLSYIPLREKVYLPLVALFLFLRVNCLGRIQSIDFRY